MGQIVTNSLKLAAAGLGDTLKLDTAPDGMQFDGIRLNITMPVTVTGTPTLAQADFVNFLKRAIGTFTLEEGPKLARRLVHAAIDGNDIRTMHRWALRNEAANNVFGSALVAGAMNMTATLYLPFSAPEFYRGTPRRPGTTQVRTMLLRVAEGTGALNGAIARAAGNITVEVEFVCSPGPDEWSPILSMQREQSPRRDAQGPDGLTLLAYVPDSPAAASALTAFNIQVNDGSSMVRVTDLQSIAPVTRAWADDMDDQGATTITDEHTVVSYLPPNTDLDRATHGATRFEEAKTDLSPVNLRFLYFPPRDALRAKAEAKATADAYGGNVKLTQPVVDEDADPGAPATQPARIYAPADARFTTKAGLLASSGSDVVTVDVPASYVTGVKAAAGAASGQGKTDVARRGVKVVSLQVPGATATDGSRKGDVADGLARSFG